jgi:hypothetical protein
VRCALLAVLLGACSVRGATNTLLTSQSALADVRAPHVSIFVYDHKGVSKVWLDSGQSERVTEDHNAIIVDNTSYVHVVDGRYVVVGDGFKKVLDWLEATVKNPKISPNGRLLAYSPDDAAIVTIDAHTGEERRYAGPPQGPTMGRKWLQFAFTPESDAIVIAQADYFRLDLATGVLSPIDKLDFELLSKPPSTVDCPTRGVRLLDRTHKGKQEIVLMATASQADPEQLATLDTRVLVRATDRAGPSGEGIMRGAKIPGPLRAELVTPTCEHFVFSLEGWIYVGNIATGKVARLASGGRALLK